MIDFGSLALLTSKFETIESDGASSVANTSLIQSFVVTGLKTSNILIQLIFESKCLLKGAKLRLYVNLLQA